MAHRDPETGQFVSDGDGGISYSDHDVHHVSHSFLAQFDNPNDLRDTQRFEITARGLDPDEIAELRTMRLHVGTIWDYAGTDDGPSNIDYRVDCGYNLGDGEFVGRGSGVALDPNSDGTDEYTSFTDDTDEVGELYHESGTVTGPVDDETNGTGSGGQYRSQTITLNMAEQFGSGPFVDSADDFVSSIRLDPNRIESRMGIALRYTLYYNVMETESGRSRFGR